MLLLFQFCTLTWLVGGFFSRQKSGQDGGNKSNCYMQRTSCTRAFRTSTIRSTPCQPQANFA
jgi:hypothetical protein